MHIPKSLMCRIQQTWKKGVLLNAKRPDDSYRQVCAYCMSHGVSRTMYVCVCGVCFEALLSAVMMWCMALAMDLSTDLILSDSQGERGGDREREREREHLERKGEARGTRFRAERGAMEGDF